MANHGIPPLVVQGAVVPQENVATSAGDLQLGRGRPLTRASGSKIATGGALSAFFQICYEKERPPARHDVATEEGDRELLVGTDRAVRPIGESVITHATRDLLKSNPESGGEKEEPRNRLKERIGFAL